MDALNTPGYLEPIESKKAFMEAWIEELSPLIGSDYPKDEQKRISRQLKFMGLVSQVLGERITANQPEVEPEPEEEENE